MCVPRFKRVCDRRRVRCGNLKHQSTQSCCDEQQDWYLTLRALFCPSAQFHRDLLRRQPFPAPVLLEVCIDRSAQGKVASCASFLELTSC